MVIHTPVSYLYEGVVYLKSLMKLNVNEYFRKIKTVYVKKPVRFQIISNSLTTNHNYMTS
ncbi:hypothetical protein DERP_015287 [Dermatophagoides pteronyssinus]|uniref:Uncharacterized protein n=1 Tax=Dermatophagoides pteronyssinus TaxID=6956 RepID=A0ABQ8J5R1_DERPT|nr:hypothetical protein DERP_015287 [Dermatophagoides pteronyssinus]